MRKESFWVPLVLFEENHTLNSSPSEHEHRVTRLFCFRLNAVVCDSEGHQGHTAE